MTLNYNSTLSKFYRFVYGTYDMPKSLCVYFWGVALSPFLFIINIPGLITFELVKKYFKSIIINHRDNNFLLISSLSIVGWLTINMVVQLILFGFFKDDNIKSVLYCLAIVWFSAIIFAVAVCLGAFTLSMLSDLIHSALGRHKVKELSKVVGGYISAKKDRVCPIIEWDDENNQ